MARDLDFRRQTQPVRRPIPSTQKPVLPKASKTATQPTSIPWPTLLLIVLLAAVVLVIYFYSMRTPEIQEGFEPVSSTKTTQNTTSSENSATDIPVSDKELVLQVYDSGAGEAAVATAVNKLKDAGYEAQAAGKSQFEYDKTYIWYVKRYAEESQKIGNLLEERTVSYKESVTSGVFDVLIYLGKE